MSFIVYYALSASVIFVLVLVVRFWQLKPLLNAIKTSAVVEQNHRGNLDRLEQLGIRVEGVGPIYFIDPPPYTPDEELIVGENMDVWVTSEAPGVILAVEPSIIVLVAQAIKPAFLVMFLLCIPLLFIIKGIFSEV